MCSNSIYGLTREFLYFDGGHFENVRKPYQHCFQWEWVHCNPIWHMDYWYLALNVYGFKVFWNAKLTYLAEYFSLERIGIQFYTFENA